MAKAAKQSKKSPRRKPRKPKAPRKRPQPRRPRKPEPASEIEPTRKAFQIDVQIDVWTAYERTRSIRATAQETGHAEHVVREVLSSDRNRQLVIVDDFLEACVAEWETKQIRAHGVMNELFRLFEALLAEIGNAQAEGRATTIVGKGGVPMPVMDAVELLVASRLFDQANKCAQVAQGISEQYRRGRAAAPTKGDGDEETPFERWTDTKLAEALRAGGIRLPTVLERKVKQIEAAAG